MTDDADRRADLRGRMSEEDCAAPLCAPHRENHRRMGWSAHSSLRRL